MSKDSSSISLFLLFLLTVFIFLSPSPLVSSSPSTFFNNLAPITGALAPGAQYHYNISIDLDTSFSLFYLNITQFVSLTLVKYGLPNEQSWAGIVKNPNSLLIVSKELFQIKERCADDEAKHFNHCFLSVVLTNLDTRSHYYSFHAYSGPEYSLLPYKTEFNSVLSKNQWNYFALPVVLADLNVLITLIPDQADHATNVDLYLSIADNPLQLLFPTDGDPATTHAKNAPLQLIINNEGSPGNIEGIYLIGIKGTETQSNGYTITALKNYNNSGSSSFKFSIYAIISILIILMLIVFMVVTCVAKRRRSTQQALLLQSLHNNQQIQLQFLQRISGNNELGVVDPDNPNVPIRNVNIHIVYNSLFRNHMENLRQQSNQNSANIGATEKEIKELKIIKFETGLYTQEDSKCTICLNDYEPNKLLRELRCKHHFCDGCIVEWLKSKRSCPLCLQDINKAEDKFDHQQSPTSPKNINNPNTIISIDGPAAASSVLHPSRLTLGLNDAIVSTDGRTITPNLPEPSENSSLIGVPNIVEDEEEQKG